MPDIDIQAPHPPDQQQPMLPSRGPTQKGGTPTQERVTVGDRTFNVRLGASDAEIVAEYQKQLAQAPGDASVGTVLTNTAHSALKGLPGGDVWAGAAIAMAQAPFNQKSNEDFWSAQQRLTNERERDQKVHETINPKEAIASEIIGPMGMYGGATKIPKIGQYLGKMMGIGNKSPYGSLLANTAFGGELGAADAAIRGNDILPATAVGAGLGVGGAALGYGVGSLASKAAGKMGQNPSGPLKGMDKRGAEWLSGAAKEDFPGGPRVAGAAVDQWSAKAGPNAMVGEAGPKLGGYMQAAGVHPEARPEIWKALDERTKSVNANHNDILDTIMGPAVNTSQLSTAIEKNRQNTVAPLYKAFYQTPVPETPETKAITATLDKFGVWKKAKEFADLEGQPWLMNGHPTAASWDYAKRALDDKIQGLIQKEGGRNEARLYNKIRVDLLNAIDNHPDAKVAGVWKKGRDAYASEQARLDALDMGENWRKISIDDIPATLAGLSGPAKQLFITGVRRDFQHVLDATANGDNTLTRTLRSRENIERLTQILGPSEARQLANYADQVMQQASSKTKMVGGSETQARAEAVKQMKPDPDNLMINRVTPEYMFGITAKEWLKKLLPMKAMEGHQASQYAASANKVAPFLTKQNQQANDTIKALLGYEPPGIAAHNAGSGATRLFGHAITPRSYPAVEGWSNYLTGWPPQSAWGGGNK